MHKKLSEKLGAKFPAITRDYSMVKLLISMTLSLKFLTASKPIRRPITAAKRKEKGKKEKRKKKLKKQKLNLERRKSLYFLVSKF